MSLRRGRGVVNATSNLVPDRCADGPGGRGPLRTLRAALSMLPPHRRCEADPYCQRTPCFRLELRDASGALFTGRAAMRACADHSGDAAKSLARVAAGVGELRGGSIQVWAIDASQAPVSDMTGVETAGFLFAAIPLDS